MCGDRSLDLAQPRVMGVLNLTPDSFSDGGELWSAANGTVDLDAVLARAEAMVHAGAAVLDVGAESTRPGATPVTPEVEAERLVMVLEQLAARFDVVLSADTSAPEVMRAAAGAGAGMLNDVRALREPGALDAAAATGLPVCLMHMQGTPATMQRDPRYDDVLEAVCAFLEARVQACAAAGIGPERVVLDPGIGFGKRLEHNLALLRHLYVVTRLGYPVMVGVSRKRMLEQLTGRETPGERVHGSVAAALAAVESGARIVRAHDVAPTVDALRVAWAIRGEAR